MNPPLDSRCREMTIKANYNVRSVRGESSRNDRSKHLNFQHPYRMSMNIDEALTFDARMELLAAEAFASVEQEQIIVLALIGRLQIELQYLQTQLANVLSILVHRVLAVGVRRVIASRVIWTDYYLMPAGDQLVALGRRRFVAAVAGEAAHCLVVAIRPINERLTRNLLDLNVEAIGFVLIVRREHQVLLSLRVEFEDFCRVEEKWKVFSRRFRDHHDPVIHLSLR